MADPVGGEGDEAVAEGTDCERNGPEGPKPPGPARLQQGPVSTTTASREMPLALRLP